MEFDWKKLVGGVAPALGLALGGPMAAAAVKIIADKMLGNPDATKDDVAAALSQGLSGDQVIALRKADQEFDLQMKQLEINVMQLNKDTESAYLKDVQDARARQIATRDPTPQVILAILFVLWAATFAAFYFGTLPDDEFVRALIVRAYATVETGLTGAIAYFIGSSRGSKSSGDAVRDIAINQSKQG